MNQTLTLIERTLQYIQIGIAHELHMIASHTPDLQFYIKSRNYNSKGGECILN